MWSLSQVKYLQFFYLTFILLFFFFLFIFFYFHEIHVNGNISLIYITRDKPFARIYLECKFVSFQEKCCPLISWAVGYRLTHALNHSVSRLTKDVTQEWIHVHRGGNCQLVFFFCFFCLLLLLLFLSSEKGIYTKKKEFASSGSKFFSFRVDLYSEEA